MKISILKSTKSFLRGSRLKVFLTPLLNIIYPDRRRLKDKNFYKLLFSRHLNSTYGDQKGQVDFLLNTVFNYQNSGLKKSGYFVDLAAADGVTGSNTYFLEKYLGWSGLIFEPNPKFQEDLLASRTMPIVTKCVTDRVGDKVKFRIDNGQLGGIVGDDFDNNGHFRAAQLKTAEIVEIETTTLEHELKARGAPELVDFLSLDVEGAEHLVLKNFPFDEYKFHCIAVERPCKELDLLLDKNKYRQVAHLFYDVLYVHEDFLEDLNFDPKIKFAFTPRKNW